MEKDSTSTSEKIIQFNESAIQRHLSGMVRHSVETTLNQMLEAEADRLCHSDKYQRSEARADTRAGFYQRKLHTKAGEVTLNMPKPRRQTFESILLAKCGFGFQGAVTVRLMADIRRINLSYIWPNLQYPDR